MGSSDERSGEGKNGEVGNLKEGKRNKNGKAQGSDGKRYEME